MLLNAFRCFPGGPTVYQNRIAWIAGAQACASESTGAKRFSGSASLDRMQSSLPGSRRSTRAFGNCAGPISICAWVALCHAVTMSTTRQLCLLPTMLATRQLAGRGGPRMWTGASQTLRDAHGMHGSGSAHEYSFIYCIMRLLRARFSTTTTTTASWPLLSIVVPYLRTFSKEEISPGLLQRARRSQCDFSQCQTTCATEEQVDAALQSASSGFVHALQLHECCQQLIRYEPLGDRCPLFMRKFKAGTEDRLQEVLSPMIAQQQAPAPTSGPRLPWARGHHK